MLEETTIKKVLDIQKKRLQIVINQSSEKTSQEEDEFVENFTNALYWSAKGHAKPKGSWKKTHWEDSEATDCVATTLQKHEHFHLYKYYDCAENVCDAFADRHNSYPEVYSSMEYVLAHARQFGDPDLTIFRIEATNPLTTYRVGSARLKYTESTEVRRETVATPIKNIITDLRQVYDEAQFKTLTTYITSLVLLMIRRSLKNRTDCVFYASRMLVVDAYLNTYDERTKRNLHEACVKYMAWHDMEMPMLFCSVLDLYDIEAEFFWDQLCSLSDTEINKSLINFGTEYYNEYRQQKDNPWQGQRWFPFCRSFGFDYHAKLSNNENQVMCFMLGELILKKEDEELANQCGWFYMISDYSYINFILKNLWYYTNEIRNGSFDLLIQHSVRLLYEKIYEKLLISQRLQNSERGFSCHYYIA